MTVTSETRIAGPFVGNDVATEFPFAFRVFLGSDVLAELIDADGVRTVLALSTDYTVELNLDQKLNPGGTLTMLDPLATGLTLTLTSSLTTTQGLDLTMLGGFDPNNIEDALDRQTILLQQNRVDYGRSLRVPEIDGTLDLPDVYSRNGRLLGFDSFGRPVALPTGTASTGSQLALDLLDPDGSALVGYQPRGALALATNQKRALDWGIPFQKFITHTEFMNALNRDTSIDISTKLQRAIDAAAAEHCAIDLGPGLYKCGALVGSTTALSVALYGRGSGATAILCGASGGLFFEFPTPDSNATEGQVVVLRDFGILASGANSGDAISLSWATAVGDTSVALDMHGVFIAARNKNLGHYFNRGLVIENGRRMYINACPIDGASLSTAMDVGIHLLGGTVEAHIYQADITNAAVGVKIEDECEGVNIKGNLVYCGTGIDWRAPVTYTGTELNFEGHMSCLDYGILADRVAHGNVFGSLIQKREGTDHNYCDIKLLTGCKLWRVHDNTFGASPTTGGTSECFTVESDAQNVGNHFYNNTIDGRGQGIWIQGNANGNRITNNRGFNIAGLMVRNDSGADKDNQFSGNTPIDVLRQGITTATPVLSGSQANRYILLQGGATTVTDFQYGVIGQQYEITAGDSNSTIQHNAVINLQGGVNFAMSAAASITLVCELNSPNFYREVARRTA